MKLVFCAVFLIGFIYAVLTDNSTRGALVSIKYIRSASTQAAQ